MEHIHISTQSVLNTLPVGVSMIKEDGTIVFMNDRYATHLGESPSDFIGVNIFSQEHLKRVDNNAHVLREVLHKRKAITGSYHYFNQKQNRTFTCKIEERPVIEGGKLNFVLVTVLEIHELIQESKQTAIIADSLPMKNLLTRIQEEAKYPANILLTGETGVGKDVIAKYIHANSLRKGGPFVVLDCTSLPENLIESELFGYERGAFTGAERSGKQGIIEDANGGTLFLDEVNSLPLQVQGKLLRAIETHKIRRVGATDDHTVDFRLISASNQDLEECVNNKTFRADLYYRISVINENIPPLRERREDIVLLVDHFLTYFCKQYNKQVVVPDMQLNEWISYEWPGNVRELRNAVERFVILGATDLPNKNIYVPPSKIQAPSLDIMRDTSRTLREQLEDEEREIIRQALLHSKTQREAAQKLGIDPAVLSRKMVHYGLRKNQ